MTKHLLLSPLSVPVSKKKSFSLNLNTYRNAHFHVLNKAKKVYKEQMSEQINLLPQLNKIQIRFTIYPKTRRKFDVGNIGSVTEKFFADALVELGKLPDDNYEYLSGVLYQFGEVDKNNPRIEIEIYEV